MTDKQKCRTTVKKKEISRTENLEEVRTEGRERGDECKKAEKGDLHIETMYTNNTEKQNRYYDVSKICVSHGQRNMRADEI